MSAEGRTPLAGALLTNAAIATPTGANRLRAGMQPNVPALAPSVCCPAHSTHTQPIRCANQPIHYQADGGSGRSPHFRCPLAGLGRGHPLGPFRSEQLTGAACLTRNLRLAKATQTPFLTPRSSPGSQEASPVPPLSGCRPFHLHGLLRYAKGQGLGLGPRLNPWGPEDLPLGATPFP